MKTNQVSTMFLIGAVLATGLLAYTQPIAHKLSSQNQSQHKMSMMDSKMMASCKAMMQKHEQMQMDMKEMDAKLDSLVSTMNSATSSDKADAAAVVITEMVAQRKEMGAKMSSMQMGMMQHMMEHMQMGKKSMMMCPMMKGMGSM